MKQFDLVNLFELIKNDIFYFASDSKKVKWEVKKIDQDHFKNIEKYHIDSRKGDRIIKKNKKVVYLRNSEE
jgi:hypothetical protein